METEKISKKNRTVPKKIQRVDALGTSGCVCFLEKGTLWIKFASLPGPDLALVGFRTGSKKWTEQFEGCSLKKNKTGTSKVGAISKAQKAQKIFWKKLGIFGKKFGKCRTVPKNVKEGTLFDFRTCILLQNNKKLKGETLWGH